MAYCGWGRRRGIWLLDQLDPEEAREKALADSEPASRLNPTG